MKMKWFSILLAMLLVVMQLAGCGANPTAPETEELPGGEVSAEQAEADLNAYSDVLRAYAQLIKNAPNLVDVSEREMGVLEKANEYGAQALNKIGYLFMDLNNDGIRELLIGTSDEADDYTKNTLLGMFTLVDGKPQFVLSSRSRSNYALMEDGSIYYGGSNGAAYRIFGTFTLGEGVELVCKDYNFSYEKDSSMTEYGFYHNTSGEYDKAASEEMKISEEAFAAKEDALAEKTAKLTFTPFAEAEWEKVSGGRAVQDEPALPDANNICGSWICNANAIDGSKYVLFVDINADGTASYRCGPPQSEILVDYNGSWSADAAAQTITFDMRDRFEGDRFYSTWQWSMESGQLLLKHNSGTAFLYGQEGRTFTFSSK